MNYKEFTRKNKCCDAAKSHVVMMMTGDKQYVSTFGFTKFY